MLHAAAHPTAVVIVDDDPLALELLRDLVAEIGGAEVFCFGAAEPALEWCRSHDPDLVITDYQLPGLSGVDLARLLREDARTAQVPLMVVTALDDRAVRYQVLGLGLNDFLTKPIDAAEVRARTRNMLAVRRGQRLLLERSCNLERAVAEATAAIAAREHEVIVRLARAAEHRDWETGMHVLRVSRFAGIVARQLGLPAAEQELIAKAATMHDVGKIGVPDSVLLKAGELDDAEFEIMKRHTIIGHQILGGSDSELLRMAADVALTHHERFDGSGYPHGRQGAAIPLCGRIVAVADSFDALTSERPYKNAWPAALAWDFLRAHTGGRFDPECVAAFERGAQEVADVRAALTDSRDAADTPAPEPSPSTERTAA
ncbi:MAG TPA: HD domain-containing phosphohydrolase [Gemmatimonadales bacterium]|nr:HD domain-containing phosphohydrolase [Gemmatimonadales bacterium]